MKFRSPRLRLTGVALIAATSLLLGACSSGGDTTADAAPEASRREAAGIVAGYLQFHLERHLKSLAVMGQDADRHP